MATKSQFLGAKALCVLCRCICFHLDKKLWNSFNFVLDSCLLPLYTISSEKLIQKKGIINLWYLFHNVSTYICIYKTIILYTLDIYSSICQSYFYKVEKKENKNLVPAHGFSYHLHARIQSYISCQDLSFTPLSIWYLHLNIWLLNSNIHLNIELKCSSFVYRILNWNLIQLNIEYKGITPLPKQNRSGNPKSRDHHPTTNVVQNLQLCLCLIAIENPPTIFVPFSNFLNIFGFHLPVYLYCYCHLHFTMSFLLGDL